MNSLHYLLSLGMYEWTFLNQYGKMNLRYAIYEKQKRSTLRMDFEHFFIEYTIYKSYHIIANSFSIYVIFITFLNTLCQRPLTSESRQVFHL